jgi:hypothetical protein
MLPGGSSGKTGVSLDSWGDEPEDQHRPAGALRHAPPVRRASIRFQAFPEIEEGSEGGVFQRAIKISHANQRPLQLPAAMACMMLTLDLPPSLL